MKDNAKIAYDIAEQNSQNFKNRMASYAQKINMRKLKKEERQEKKK